MAFTREFYELFLDELIAELKTQKTAEILQVYISPVRNGEGSVGHIGISFQRANWTYHGASFNLMDDGQVFYSSSLLGDKAFLYPAIFRWKEYVWNRFYAAERIKDFWEEAKEELVAVTWRPDRVAKWVEAGMEMEAM